MKQENQVTNLTTDAAAREVMAKHDAEAVRSNFSRCGCDYCAALRPTLTPQKGGEQEAGDDLMEFVERYFSIGYAQGKEGRITDTPAFDALECRYEIESRIDALRSKQPAASEGDGLPSVPPCKACGGRGCIDHGDTEIGAALFDCEECDGSGLDNTSKQAAGEAVEQCCECNSPVDTRENGTPGAELSDGRWVCSDGCFERATADDTPPRHPADEGRSAVTDAMVERAVAASDAYWVAPENQAPCPQCEGSGAVAVGTDGDRDYCDCQFGTTTTGTEHGAMRAAIDAALQAGTQ